MKGRLTRRIRRRLRTAFRPTIDANIFFMHLPKCGGTSVSQAMRKGYADPKQVFTLRARPSARAAALAGREVLEYRRSLLLFVFAQQQRGCIQGHFPFSLRAWTEFRDRWSFITVLRHPVRRWFSHYFYNRYHDRDKGRIREDLEAFLETPRAAHEGCMYVRFLAEGAVGEAAREEAQIDAAIANLEKFDLVATLEHLSDFTTRFRQTFGVPLAIEKRNENPLSAERRRQMVTPDLSSRVEELCRPDMRIYQRALELNHITRSKAVGSSVPI